MLHLTGEAMLNRNYDVCSRWAPARRVMQDGCKYSIPDYPYIEGILDSRAKNNWIMKGTQVGLTEGGITIATFEADYHHRDVIYYFPTKKMAERFSKTRFSPAINLSEYLAGRCTNNSVETKQFGNATIHILGANSSADLKGTSSGRLIFDELDEWTDQQIYMAEERSSGQKNDDTIIWGFSTPLYPNKGIHKQYLRSTQEHFRFDCPSCRERIELRWPDSFELCGEHESDPELKNSRIICYACGAELPHEEKVQGRSWLATRSQGGTAAWEQTNGGPELMKLNRGFYLPQLYSPTVAPYKISLKFLRSRGDEAASRTFWNDCAGLPYITDQFQVTDADIDKAIQKHGLYSTNDVGPFDVDNSYVTLGIDQGGPLHHWVAVNWVFDAAKPGDPNDKAFGKLVGFGQILQDNWGELAELMHIYCVRMCVIDAAPQPTSARSFAKGFAGAVYANYYNTTLSTGGRDIRLINDEYGANVSKTDNVGWMTKSLGRIINGAISFPTDVTMELRDQLKAPVRTMQKIQGHYFAKYLDGDSDHYAHALTYAEIALKIQDPDLHTDDDEIRE